MRMTKRFLALGSVAMLGLAGCEASVDTEGDGVNADVDIDEDGDGSPDDTNS